MSPDGEGRYGGLARKLRPYKIRRRAAIWKAKQTSIELLSIRRW